jgi:hypothetical protein
MRATYQVSIVMNRSRALHRSRIAGHDDVCHGYAA